MVHYHSRSLTGQVFLYNFPRIAQPYVQSSPDPVQPSIFLEESYGMRVRVYRVYLDIFESSGNHDGKRPDSRKKVSDYFTGFDHSRDAFVFVGEAGGKIDFRDVDLETTSRFCVNSAGASIADEVASRKYPRISRNSSGFGENYSNVPVDFLDA